MRAVRIRRALRQEDVASRARVHRSTISRIERGHIGSLSLDTLRRSAAALDIRVMLLPWWRGGELDRLLNARHSAMHEELARLFRDLPEWIAAPEVSFAIFGERGVIDILAWHPSTRTLLVIELKTELVDMQDLVGTVDRKRRLAARVARERGWNPERTAVWVVIARSERNRRAVHAHAAFLRSAFPDDGRRVTAWLRHPVGSFAALSFVSIAHPGHAKPGFGGTQRVRRPVDRST